MPPGGSHRARGQGPPPPRASGPPWRAFGQEADGEHATKPRPPPGSSRWRWRSRGSRQIRGVRARRRPAGKGRRLGRSIRSSAMSLSLQGREKMGEREKEGDEGEKERKEEREVQRQMKRNTDRSKTLCC
uniref:Uncharacterized protein n=1 Tax=Triticum urartu TaxID=4572 RepID=A0A8R7P0L5_TRIUA